MLEFQAFQTEPWCGKANADTCTQTSSRVVCIKLGRGRLGISLSSSLTWPVFVRKKKKSPSLEGHIPPLIVHAALRALTGLSTTSLKYTLPLVVLIGGVDLCVLLLVKNNHSSGHYSCCTSSFNWCNARRNESEGGPQKPASEWEPTRTELLFRAKKVQSWQLTRSCRGVFHSAISLAKLSETNLKNVFASCWIKVNILFLSWAINKKNIND